MGGGGGSGGLGGFPLGGGLDIDGDGGCDRRPPRAKISSAVCQSVAAAPGLEGARGPEKLKFCVL